MIGSRLASQSVRSAETSSAQTRAGKSTEIARSSHMNTDPVFVGTIEELEREHNETLNDAQCRSHSVGTCPNCPEDICPLCEGSGYCIVAAVEHPGVRATAGRSQEGVLHVDDREIRIPCVMCKASSGEERRWPHVEERVPDHIDVEIRTPSGAAVQFAHSPTTSFLWKAHPGFELNAVIELEMTPKRKDGTPW